MEGVGFLVRYPRSDIRSLVCIAVLLVLSLQARGERLPEHPPLPRPRPAEANAPVPELSETESLPKQPVLDEACLGRLKAAGVEFDSIAMPPAANPACMIDTPVRLRAVRILGGPRAPIRLPDGPVLSCRFSERFGAWLSQLAAPLVAGRLTTEIRAVRTGPGYECRNRNRAEKGKISAHANGIAIDVSTFELADGKLLPIKPNDDAGADGTVEALRVAACGWFTTVLGPGSDAAHGDHLHLDIQAHGSSDRYRLCQ